MKRAIVRALAAGILGLGCQAGLVQATTITYTAVDLADTTVGEDLWQYRYTVSGTFPAFGGFNVLFNSGLYSQLDGAPAAPSADWAVATTQPDAVLTVDGVYAATASIAGASLADPFVLSFVWLGSGAPGAQPFEVFDDSFSVTEQGRTRAPSTQPPTTGMPLPGSLALTGLGLFLLARSRATPKKE